MNKKTKKATNDLMNALEYALFAGFYKRLSGLDRVIRRMNGEEVYEPMDLRDYKIEGLSATLKQVTYNSDFLKHGKINRNKS